MNDTVGMIGLGNLGRAIARRLVGQGVHVVGYDPGPAAESARAAGVGVLAGAAQVTREAGTVFTCVPDAATVRDVWLGDGGLLATCRQPTTLVELSTIEPDAVREVGEAALARATRSPTSVSAAAPTRP